MAYKMFCKPTQGFVVAPVIVAETVFFVFCVTYRITALSFGVPSALYPPGTRPPAKAKPLRSCAATVKLPVVAPVPSTPEITGFTFTV
ncbi:hypothetical protein D3C85_1142490 [compost metagenome]